MQLGTLWAVLATSRTILEDNEVRGGTIHDSGAQGERRKNTRAATASGVGSGQAQSLARMQ